MSLFPMMGEFDDDIMGMGNHMNAMNMQMRSMNRLMNSFMPDPFQMLSPFDNGFQQNALMERGPAPHMGLFGFPAMPNMNRLLSAGNIGVPNGASFCSSSVISMSSGPDGRPQIYQATSSTKTGPGGVRETRKTVQDSVRGVKKMAIGHHIGERAHIIEKEQNTRSGQLEEHQEFINLDEEEAEDFDREFTTKIRGRRGRAQEVLSIEPVGDDDDEQPQQMRRILPALPAPPQQQQQQQQQQSATSSSPTATSTAHDSITTTNNSNNTNNHSSNNNYLHTTPRRAYRSHHISGATPRRPLRTPCSSPLALSACHSLHTTATPSVHPHPYNAAAARRHHRPKHTKHHQEGQSESGGSTKDKRHGKH